MIKKRHGDGQRALPIAREGPPQPCRKLFEGVGGKEVVHVTIKNEDPRQTSDLHEVAIDFWADQFHVRDAQDQSGVWHHGKGDL